MLETTKNPRKGLEKNLLDLLKNKGSISNVPADTVLSIPYDDNVRFVLNKTNSILVLGDLKTSGGATLTIGPKSLVDLHYYTTPEQIKKSMSLRSFIVRQGSLVAIKDPETEITVEDITPVKPPSETLPRGEILDTKLNPFDDILDKAELQEENLNERITQRGRRGRRRQAATGTEAEPVK